tara:strand:- start:12873 stop:13580 length:708 start_codon:yes stop_codon:yes gene_type:complete
MKTIMIRQPGYMPNIGFFKKIEYSDIFVFLDDTQFSKDSFDNRNKIKTKSTSKWISVPLKRPVFKKKLNQVIISYDTDWIKSHTDLIYQNYKDAPYFSSYWNEIKKILEQKSNLLIDLNLNLISYFLKILQINTTTIKSSELKITNTKTQRLIDICAQLNASCYISGIGGKNYVDESLFKNSDIKLTYENSIHPNYNQIHGNFMKNMSIIDLIFNEGEKSSEILNKIKFSQIIKI